MIVTKNFINVILEGVAMNKDTEIEKYCASHTDCDLQCNNCPAYYNDDDDEYSLDDGWNKFEDEEFMCGIY